MTDFSSAISAVDGANASAAQSLVTDTSPDDAARAFQLESSTGVPADHIGKDLDGFEEQNKKALGQSIISNNGYIADFVNKHPLHGPLISDDLGNLDKLSQSYQRFAPGGHPLERAFKGFREGFGGDALGTEYPQSLNDADKYPLATSLLAPLGIPMELIGRTFRGLIQGGYEGVKSLGRSAGLSEQAAHELAQGLAELGQYELIKPEFKAGIGELRKATEAPEDVDIGRRDFLKGTAAAAASTLIPKLPKGPGRLTDVIPPYAQRRAFTPGPMTNAFEQITEEAMNLRPWLEAGEEPPAGVSRVVDAGKGEVAKLDQEAIKQALDDANSTALKERSPEKFGEFLDEHPGGTIAIEKEAIAKNPQAFDWIPNLEAELVRPLSKIEVSAKDFLLNFDKELWPEVKDFISRGGPTANEAKEIIAYHGSPHDFNKFDFSKIGLGEGAQAYGHGLYFAESEEVAKTYRDLANTTVNGQPFDINNPLHKAVQLVNELDSREAALTHAREMFKHEPDQFWNSVAEHLEGDKPIPKMGSAGRMYQVSIKADSEHFLDWDKPLSDQNPEVQKALGKAFPDQYYNLRPEGAPFSFNSDAEAKAWAANNGIKDFRVFDIDGEKILLAPHGTGEQLLRTLHTVGEQEKATEALRAAGIPGIKYLDQGSRAASRGSRNYVVFDNKLIDILRKDGELVTPGEREALLRQVIQRDPRGRPIQTAPLGDTDRLVEGIRRAAGLDPQGGVLESLIEGADETTIPETASTPLAQPFTDANAFGRTRPEYRRYLELIAQRDAEDVAYREKRAKAQVERENTQAWKDARRELEPEIRDEVRQRPEIAAWNFFENGEVFGQKLPRRPKLDRAALTEDQFNALPAEWIRDGGLAPDEIASTFDYSSGSELADALAAISRQAEGTRGSIIDRLTEAELQRQLEARLGKDAAERLDEAKDHALSLTTMEMLHEQVVALGMRLGVELPLDKGRMDWGAREILHRLTFGAVSYRKLSDEAGKASRLLEKSLLTDDPLTAFKQAQNHYTITQVAKEFLAVEKETKKFEKNARRFRDREVSGVDPEYTNWIHDILLRIGRPVRKSVQDLQKEIDAQPNASLADFLLSKLNDGYDIAVPDFLVDPSFRKPIEQMTVLEARQTMRAIESLRKVGRAEKQVEIQGNKFDLADKLKEVNDQLKTLGPAREPTHVIWNVGRRFLAGTLQAEFLFNRLDFGDVFGLISQWAWRPMAEGANAKAKLGKQIAKALPEIPKSIKLDASVPNTLFKDWQSGLQSNGKIDWAQAAPLKLTQKNLLAIMHNLGNVDNLKRLANGYGLEPQKVMDWVNTVATKDHWDYVQAFGDVFKDLKSKSDAMYRRISGAAPEAVDIFPIDTPHGQYDGWYHPIIHDFLFEGQYKNEKSNAPFAKEYQMAMPSAGYTKSRTTYRGPLDLNLDSITNRLVQEIHDISFREAVIQANKLIGNSTFRNHLTTHYGRAYTDMLKRWVQDVANGANIASANQAAWARPISEFFRQNIIGSLVGLNPRTVQKHTITAAINSMSEVGAANFLTEFRNIWLNPAEGKKNWDFAMETSEELQRRHQNFMEQVSGAHDVAINPPGQDLASTFAYARQQALRLGTTPVAFFDLASAVPTWLAKYNVMKKLGRSEGDAIYAADTAVRNAHGSSAVTSRPELMRDYPWLASLYGFFNHIANQQYKLAWKAKEAAGLGSKPADIGQLPGLALGVFSYVIAPAIIEELVTPFTNKERESWGKKAAKTLTLGLSSSWIGIRDIARAIIDGKDPTIGLAGAGGKALTDLTRDLAKGDFGFDRAHAGKTIKHSIVAFGAATGLTNAAEGNLAEYLYNLHRGVEKPPKDMKELWRGVSKGSSNPPTGPDLIERALPGRVRRVP